MLYARDVDNEMKKLLRLVQRMSPSNPTDGTLGSIELDLWLAHLVGLPLLGLKDETRMQRICFAIYGGMMQFALVCYICIFELYDLLLNWHDLDAMTQNAVLSLTHVVYLLKLLNLCYHYTGLKEIISKLRSITKQCVLSQKQTEAFHKSEVESKMANLIYFNLVLTPGAMGLIWIMIFPEDFAGNLFPYRAELPQFLPATIKHFYMGLSVAFSALAITTIDTLNVLLMNHICMHLKVLNLAFDELLESTVDPKDWLISIVKYHCELIVLRHKVETIFSLPVMLQFVSSVVIVAMTAFQVIAVGDGSKSSIIMDLLLCCVLCQLFVYCWFGNEVYEQSKTLSTSGFGCGWQNFDAKSKRILLIFMINAEHPFLFTAGGFMGLTLPSFTYIISKSYSIVAVLRQMYTRV